MTICYLARAGSQPRRWLTLTVWLLVVLGLAEITAGGGAAPENRGAEAGKSAPERPEAEVALPVSSTMPVRMREGTQLTDQLGDFQKAGDRYNFYAQDGRGVIRVLENLALERVARALVDDPSPRTWSVSGVVTEFRNENFLLITRAALKSRSVPTPTTSGGGRN